MWWEGENVYVYVYVCLSVFWNLKADSDIHVEVSSIGYSWSRHSWRRRKLGNLVLLITKTYHKATMIKKHAIGSEMEKQINQTK